MKSLLFLFIVFLTLKTDLIAAEAGMPQLDPKYWASQAFWLAITFLALYLVISKIFIPKIENNIDSRENKIRKDLEEAKTFKEESEKKLKAYNEIILKAQNDSKKIISESRQKLNEEMQVKKKEIQKKIELEMKNAEKEIEKFKKESIGKVDLISTEITSNLLKNIFGEEPNESSVKATVSQTLKEYKTNKL
tara:strand:- start:1893 stop:2468 length:576 start_codon:yes stop_codon:yes gene_type:complete